MHGMANTWNFIDNTLTSHKASRETSTKSERNHGRKRPRTNKGRGGGVSIHPQPLAESFHVQQGPSEMPPTDAAPALMSFESRIALALQGSNWGELQKSITAVQPQIPVPETVVTEPEIAVPDDVKPEMSAKQKKKREQFDRTIARDTGSVVQIIHAETVAPVDMEVTWDQDPELLCSYNWQASDETNTIFGELFPLFC
jgi:hypothetical protein